MLFLLYPARHSQSVYFVTGLLEDDPCGQLLTVSFQQICVELHAWHDHVASREVLTSTLWKLALHVQWSTLVAFTPAEAFPGHMHAAVLLDPDKEYWP